MTAHLRYVLLFQRASAFSSAVRFYREGLGLSCIAETETWAELETGGSRIALKAVDGHARVWTAL